MNAHAVPSHRWDWVLRLLAIKFRIRDPAVDLWPRLYRQGPNVILCAYRYLTPQRSLLWLRIVEKVTRTAFLALVVTILIALVDEWATAVGSGNLALSVGICLGLLITLNTQLHKPIGRLLLGKKTVIEFSASKVKVYRNGYGLSWPRVIRRHPEFEVSSDIDEHERGKAEALKLRNPQYGDERAAIVYQNSFRVKIIHGGRIERVAEVYDEFFARRLAQGIKKAEELRQSIVAARLDNQAKKLDLPE